MFTSSFVVTKSKPAFFNIAATIVTSLTGFASLGAFLYAELPTTNATRFSAKAELQPSQVAITTKTIVRNTPIPPSDEIVPQDTGRATGDHREPARRADEADCARRPGPRQGIH